MTRGGMSRLACVSASLAAALAIAGCSAIGGLAGGVAGIASGAATANPAVGVAIGIGVNAVVDESIKTVLRRWSHEEQTVIAEAVDAMAVGERRRWAVSHPLPYSDTSGTVTVTRAFDTPLAPCKEALFSAAGERGGDAPPFVTTVCRAENGWNWALAEPATARWGALQ